MLCKRTISAAWRFQVSGGGRGLDLAGNNGTQYSSQWKDYAIRAATSYPYPWSIAEGKCIMGKS